jgi:hypothetical protein
MSAHKVFDFFIQSIKSLKENGILTIKKERKEHCSYQLHLANETIISSNEETCDAILQAC